MIFLLILNFCTYGFIMFCFNGRIFNFCFSVFSSYDFLMCLIWFDMLFTSFFLWCVSCDMFHHFPFWPVLQSTFSITCVVLATAPKQHCNVEWFPPPQGWEGLLTYKNICLFFLCVLLCARCWNSHVVRKMAAIPWRVQALLAWSGAHGSLDQGTGVLIFTRSLPPWISATKHGMW